MKAAMQIGFWIHIGITADIGSAVLEEVRVDFEGCVHAINNSMGYESCYNNV